MESLFSDNTFRITYCYLKIIAYHPSKMSKESVNIMNNGSRFSRIFVILGVVLVAAGIILALASIASFGLERIFSFGQISGSRPFDIDRIEYDVDEERVEPVSGIRHISIASISDNIRLIPVDSDEIQAHYYGNYSTTNPDYRPEMIVEKNGYQLDIKIKYHSNHLLISFNSDLKLDVYIPRQFKDDLEIMSTSGDVTVGSLNIQEFDYSNTSGSLNAERIEAEKASLSTTSGEARLSGKFNSFKFATTSGNLISDDFTSKKSELNTTSGEIKLSGQPGDVNSTGISGNLNLFYTDFRNTIEANTVSGEVEIRLPADAGFKLEYGTVSGEAECDFAVSDRQGKKGLKGTVGNGEGSVRVNTISGNLKIGK